MVKPRAVGVFVYAGGFTQGMRSRFTVRTHLENAKPYCRESAEANHGVDVRPYGWWTESTGADLDGDVWYSNPPCAPFSNSGMRLGSTAEKWKVDPRIEDHVNAVQVAARNGAELIALESVAAAVKRGAGLYEKIQPKGYELSYVFHDASLCGSPQKRPRVFVVYHQSKLDEMRLDEERAVLTPDTWKGLGGQALIPAGGRPGLAGALAATLPGEKLLRGWERVGSPRPGVPSAVASRLEWGETCPTMSGTYGYGHPDEDRFITLKEMKRICGYPDDYKFYGSANDQVLAMVRAVMPPVASRLAEALRGSLQERPSRKAKK